MAKTRGGETNNTNDDIVIQAAPSLEPPPLGFNDGSASGSVATGDDALSKKEFEEFRAKATTHAANAYLALKRSGSATVSVKECCDRAALETGYPRPAETSVRRLLPKLMTPAEKEEKAQRNKRADRRAEATKRAADLYISHDRGNQTDENGQVIMSVTRACDTVEPIFGIRPAETSVRRLLQRMDEERDGKNIEPKKKKARTSKYPGAGAAALGKSRKSKKDTKATGAIETTLHGEANEHGAPALLHHSSEVYDSEVLAAAAALPIYNTNESKEPYNKGYTNNNPQRQHHEHQAQQQQQVYNQNYDEVFALAQEAAQEYFETKPSSGQPTQHTEQQTLAVGHYDQHQQQKQKPQSSSADGNLPALPTLEEINDIVGV